MSKVLIFRGPQHHGPLMRPVEQELAARGWELVYYTANTEACFQVGLNKELGVDGYKWLPDYIDKPRARRLYEAHAKQAMRLLQEENVLSMLLPQVLDRILLFSCEEWTATERLLREVRPDRALALHEINRWGVMLGYWCQRLKVPLFTMQEGLYYGDPWIYTGHTTYGTSLVWGEGTRQQLIAAGCPAEKIVVTGHPDLARRIAQGKQDAAGLPVPDGQRVALLLFAQVHVGEQAAMLLEGLTPDWTVVVRPHPMASLTDLRDMEERFGKRCVVLPVGTDDAVKFAWMARAEVCLVAGCSSVILECLAAEKPLGLIPTANMARDYAAEGIGVSCEGMTLQESLQKILHEWEGYRERAQAWVRQEAKSLDAAGRMADVIVSG